mgnify:CR=1 FL=1
MLGRGQFVGERAVINDKLRSADCVAQGQVQVVVLKKREFMDLDNPLLAWMLDYDAVSAVIRVGAASPTLGFYVGILGVLRRTVLVTAGARGRY